MAVLLPEAISVASTREIIETLMVNRIDVQRGVRGAGFAALLGLGAAAVAAILIPDGSLLSPAIYSMFVCAGWLAYAPTGRHRLTSALAGLLLASWVAVDAAVVARPNDPAYLILVAIATHVIVTIVFTAIRGTQLSPLQNQPGQTEPGVGADSR